MIAFASYVEHSVDFNQSFSEWLEVRVLFDSYHVAIRLIYFSCRRGLRFGSQWSSLFSLKELTDGLIDDP